MGVQKMRTRGRRRARRAQDPTLQERRRTYYRTLGLNIRVTCVDCGATVERWHVQAALRHCRPCSRRNRRRRARWWRAGKDSRLSVKAWPYMRWSLWGAQDGCCAICREPIAASAVDGAEVNIDHILPLAAGGSDHRFNLQLTHVRCNGSKGAKVDLSDPNLQAALRRARHIPNSLLKPGSIDSAGILSAVKGVANASKGTGGAAGG